jgi:hypothetical protein
MSEDDALKAMGQVIQIDEAGIRDHLGEMVRGTVEVPLNALLDAEADRLFGGGRTRGRQDTLVAFPAGQSCLNLTPRDCDTSLEQPGLPNAT